MWNLASILLKSMKCDVKTSADCPMGNNLLLVKDGLNEWNGIYVEKSGIKVMKHKLVYLELDE